MKLIDYYKALDQKYGIERNKDDWGSPTNPFPPTHYKECFSHERFSELIDETVDKIYSLVNLKGAEYAGDVDRLANFRKQSEELDLTMEQIWSVYASKHWSAVTQYIKDISNGVTRTRMEGIDGRVDDLIVYLLLFKAMVEERQ